MKRTMILISVFSMLLIFCVIPSFSQDIQVTSWNITSRAMDMTMTEDILPLEMPRNEAWTTFQPFLVTRLNRMDIFYIPSEVMPPGYVALVYYDYLARAKRMIIMNDLP